MLARSVSTRKPVASSTIRGVGWPANACCQRGVEVDVGALEAGRVGVRDVVREHLLPQRRAGHRALEPDHGGIEQFQRGVPPVDRRKTHPWVSCAPAIRAVGR